MENVLVSLGILDLVKNKVLRLAEVIPLSYISLQAQACINNKTKAQP